MEKAQIENAAQATMQFSTQKKLEEIHTQQAKLRELQSELDVMESKLEKGEKLSEDDVKFTAELGWLSAAAVAIAAVATTI
ncbi:MAG: hypothetical protein WCB93_00780 [Gallionella sp.]